MTSFESVNKCPSSSAEIRLMWRSVKSRRRPLHFIERRTSNITISLLSPTTTLRSPSCGWRESSSVIQTWWVRCIRKENKVRRLSQAGIRCRLRLGSPRSHGWRGNHAAVQQRDGRRRKSSSTRWGWPRSIDGSPTGQTWKLSPRVWRRQWTGTGQRQVRGFWHGFDILSQAA